MTKKDKSLGSKARSGFGWNLFGNLFKQFFTIVVSILIARILGPEDYGVVAIALIFVSFSQIFVDVGFTEGIIQRQEVSNTALSSVFFFNLFASSFLAILVYFLAPLIGQYFENSNVVEVIEYLVLVLPIAALGKVHSAILTKEMRFKSLSQRDIISAFVGGTIGITTAYLDFGVYSLVWQQLSTALTGTILLWIGSKWLPQLSFSWRELKKLLSFSIFVFFDTLVQQIFDKIDSIFVGKYFSPTVLGLYTRANSLCVFINDFSSKSLSNIIFPLFSSLQSNPDQFKLIFTKSINITVVFACFLAGIMFFSSEFIIITLLGEKWRQSIVLFQILIFLTISQPLRAIVFRAILGMGYSKLKFKIGLLNNFIKLTSIPIGYFYGIEALAWMVVVGRFVIVLVSWVAFQSIVTFDVKKVLKPVILPFIILSFWIGLFYIKTLNISMFIYQLFFVISFLSILTWTNNFGYFLMLNELEKTKLMILRRFN